MPCMSLGPRSLGFCSMDRGPRDERVRGHRPFWMARIKMRTERPTPTVEPPAGMSLPQEPRQHQELTLVPAGPSPSSPFPLKWGGGVPSASAPLLRFPPLWALSQGFTLSNCPPPWSPLPHSSTSPWGSPHLSPSPSRGLGLLTPLPHPAQVSFLSPPVRLGSSAPSPDSKPSPLQTPPSTPQGSGPSLHLASPLPLTSTGIPSAAPPTGSPLRAPSWGLLIPLWDPVSPLRLSPSSPPPPSLVPLGLPPPPFPPSHPPQWGSPQPRDSRGTAGVFLPRPRRAPWKGRGLWRGPPCPPPRGAQGHAAAQAPRAHPTDLGRKD